MKFLYDLKNKLDFYIRRKIRYSRIGYSEPSEDLTSMFDYELKQRENDLKKKYNFAVLSDLSILNYRENLYMLDILDKYFLIDNKQKIKVMDIGCKNWNYVKGQYVFFHKYSEVVDLKGIEIDAYRLYYNFYSRYEVAQFYQQGLENTEYLPLDFMKYDSQFDYLTWFLPFVREYPHIKWGLPLKYFKPEKMLWHAYFSLKTGGKIFIVNQSELEYQLQRKLLKDCAIPFEEIGEIESKFLDYKYKRYALTVTKKGVDDKEWML